MYSGASGGADVWCLEHTGHRHNQQTAQHTVDLLGSGEQVYTKQSRPSITDCPDIPLVLNLTLAFNHIKGSTSIITG